MLTLVSTGAGCFGRYLIAGNEQASQRGRTRETETGIEEGGKKESGFVFPIVVIVC